MVPARREPLHTETQIRALMGRQLGLITTTQALKWMSHSATDRRVRAGVWERVDGGPFREVPRGPTGGSAGA
jgi:hypothetical protein